MPEVFAVFVYFETMRVKETADAPSVEQDEGRCRQPGGSVAGYRSRYLQKPHRMLSNPRFDPQPGVILYCLCEADVAIALNLASGGSAATPFTIRSSGHSTAGFSAASGLLIDVSGIYDVYIDPQALTATVGAGCNFGRLSRALHQYGLHVPIGECSDVCVAGFMQGGGYGFTSRLYGMECDNVLSVRVMLADGSIVKADAITNSDLFWAVRGGTGGNFGVLLSVVFRLHVIGDILGWSVVWPLGTPADRGIAAAALLAMQADYMRTAPPELTPQLIFAWQPQGPNTADQVPTMICRGAYVGTKDQGMAAIHGLIAMPGAQFQFATMGSFHDINGMLLSTPYPILPFPDTGPAPFEDKQARYVARELTEANFRELLDWFVTSPNPFSAMAFEVAGGGINAVPLEETAFIHRTSQFSAFLDVFWFKPEDRPASIAFLGAFCAFFERFWNTEIYQNYVSLNVPDYRANYWGRAFDALAAVKAKYDPGTLFNFPQAAVPYPDGPRPPTWPPAVVAALTQPIAVAHPAPPCR
jgi:hypothetical protein